ncbi:MAG: hypothetical protein U1C57_01835 [Candidatus Doudnabacteria bacterium]|nr:hypothetical protein [bacterium]MDZ4243825.1 hypothetical protein [Candidatus Doudnabacteria bacterium]
MSWLVRQIQKLQNRPYAYRVRFLWTAVAVVGMIILVVWLLTIRYRNPIANNSRSGFDEIWTNIKKIKDIWPSQTQ